MISSSHLKKQAINIVLETFKLFLYVKVDKKLQKFVFFTQFLICAYIDNLEIIIKNSSSIDLHKNFLLSNNKIKPLLFEDQITS